MGKMNITLSDELEKKFRDMVAHTLGFKKGNLQIAVEEAIEEWITKQKMKGEGGK